MDRSLISYAFLAQAFRGETDLLMGLAPIFKPIAKAHAGKRFDPREFCAEVARLYGFKIHPWAAEDFAPRLQAAGVLVRNTISKELHDYHYAPIQEEFESVAERDISAVVDRFTSFARPVLESHGFQYSDTELEELIIQQLKDLDFISILLKPKQQRTSSERPLLSLKKPEDQVKWEKETSVKARIDVLCASFILDASRNAPEIYTLLVRIAAGALLTEVVLDFQAPAFTGNLNGLTVVLDAPFLMSRLDLASEEAHSFARDLCDQLQTHGATLATFSHCVDELRDNLKAVKASVEDGTGYGATARRLSNGPFAAYLNSVLDDAEARLKLERIRVMEIADSSKSFQFFTDLDQQSFRGTLGYYDNPLAQDRDAASVAGIIRLRRNTRVKMSRFGTAGYVFVTENSMVATRARQYLMRKRMYADSEVPPVITDRYLAGLLWVMYGGKASELAPKLLLANCAGALEPRSDVIVQMYDFLKNVNETQATHFRALLTDERAGQHLMQLTLGDSAFLTRENAPQLLEQLKATLIESHQQKTAAEIAEQARAHEAERNALLEKQRALAGELLESRTNELKRSAEVDSLREQVRELRGLMLSDTHRRTEQTRQALERIAIRAVLRRKRQQATVVFLFGAGSAAIAYVAGQAVLPAYRLLLAVAAGALATISFWKAPDWFFGSWIDRRLTKWADAQIQSNAIPYSETEFRMDLREGRAYVNQQDLSTGTSVSNDEAIRPKLSGTAFVESPADG